jgi:hypothetical protein
MRKQKRQKKTKAKVVKSKKQQKVKVSKPKKQKAKVKPVKKQKVLSVNINQFDAMYQWLQYYKTNNKLPHNRIVCSNCKTGFVGLKGIGMVHAMKKFDNDINRILNESLCKECKPKEEPKPRVVEFLTREEMEYRRAEISASLPKMKFREPNIIDIAKNKDVCKQYTYFSCHRPDIYLDYGCAECSLQKHCACPIKNINRKPDVHRRKKK